MLFHKTNKHLTKARNKHQRKENMKDEFVTRYLADRFAILHYLISRLEVL